MILPCQYNKEQFGNLCPRSPYVNAVVFMISAYQFYYTYVLKSPVNLYSILLQNDNIY